MNKKISFKRPDKPVPREVDDWVAANPEAPQQADAPSGGKKAPLPRPAAKQGSRSGTARNTRRTAYSPAAWSSVACASCL